MYSINETKASVSKLSSDFEVRGNDWRTSEAKNFLKELDKRQAELGIDKEAARKAVAAYWVGNFPQALKCVWGKKVIEDFQKSGYCTTMSYTVPGWGIYTEKVDHSPNQAYVHSVDLSLEGNENPDFALKSVYHCYVPKKGTDMTNHMKEDSAMWRAKSVAQILNFLFVGFECRDLELCTSRGYCPCVNKINK